MVGSDGSETRATEKEFAQFIGDNAEKYVPVFREFDKEGAHNKLSWHWPAFFFGFIWMAYRRMYAWALVALFLEGVVRYLTFYIIQHPIVAEASIRVFYGLIADFLYFKYAKNKILELKRHKSIFDLEKEGGVNRWADFLINKELRFRSKKRETEVQAGKYAKYVLAFLNSVVWLLVFAGIVFQDESLLMGGGMLGMMLVISYLLPARFISDPASQKESDSWGLFFMWLNIGAITLLTIISYIQKLFR